MTISLDRPQHTGRGIKFVWLDLTRRCQLECTHCLNGSSPTGSHGTMDRQSWESVLEQAAASGIGQVRIFGGEPTTHPDGAHLFGRALDLGMTAEVFSNLFHVPRVWWDVLLRDGAHLATSYYGSDPAEHNAITGRSSHARTRANLLSAIRLGIALRVEIVDTGDGRDVEAARQEMLDLGVETVHINRVQPFGRAADGQAPDSAKLCGNCGVGTASIGPDGAVSPCVFSTDMVVGNVREVGDLTAILYGAAMADANAVIRAAVGGGDEEECGPGTPLSGCGPKA